MCSEPLGSGTRRQGRGSVSQPLVPLAERDRHACSPHPVLWITPAPAGGWASSLLLPLLLAGCGFLASNSSTFPRTPTASTTANTSPTPADQTATASEISTPGAAPTRGSTPPTATAAPVPVPFKVTGVAFGAWPATTRERVAPTRSLPPVC